MNPPGRQIGRYRILEQLGSGGMSVVFKGLDTALDREVAVKVLHPHLAHKEEARKRLAREAKAVAKLQHPNILEVFDFSAEGSEDAYIVTEYIRGQTLRQFVNQHPFSPPEVAAMVVQGLADALSHAHQAGVIHRDLKPENAMVREDGVLKLMDFGIAKIIDRDERMTMTGALVGSPAHMAPEIIEGEEARPQSDVFSLGTMLFLFATGKLPFTGPNTTAVLKRILDAEFEDPVALSPAVSDELAEIIRRCLARDPADRYAHAGELHDALGSYLGGFGLDRVGEQLALYFADPGAYAQALVGRLTHTLLERGVKQLAEQRPAKALASLNQVLALDPENTRALELIAGMNAARRRRQRLFRVAKLSAIALGVLAVAGVSVAGVRWMKGRHVASSPSTPVAGSVADVTPPGKKIEIVEVPIRPAPAAPKELVVPARARVEAPPKPAVLPIRIQVRPFGYVSIDGGPRTSEALALHGLNVPAGQHRITVSCELCDDEVDTIEVRPGAENRFRLRAQLKPATVAFEVQPPTALVRVGAVERSSADSRSKPFEVTSPKGPTTLQHRIEYEVRAPGFKTVTKSAAIPPGGLTVIEERLVPQ